MGPCAVRRFVRDAIGHHVPTSGQVFSAVANSYDQYRERDRMSFTIPVAMCAGQENAAHSCCFSTSPYPGAHLDEPQFSTQDGYIGFMLSFFKQLRANGRAVMLCVHPYEPFHIDVMREHCERFLFVADGQVTEAPTYSKFLEQKGVRDYLGALADC